ncbi:MAG: oligosaccharide flippase family protein [Candidatus Dormibacter sp.]
MLRPEPVAQPESMALAEAATRAPARASGSLALSIGAGFLVQILSQATTLLTRIVLARIILPTEWGVFGEAVVIVLIVDTLRELNLTQWATSGGTTRHWRDLPGALVATTALMLVLLAAALPLLARLSPQLPLTTAVLAITLIPRAWTLGAEAELNSRQRLFRLVGPQAAGALGFVLSAIIISAHFKTAWSLSVAAVIQVSIYAVLLLWSSGHEVFLRPRLESAWRSLVSARDFVWLALAGVLMSQVDGLMVGSVAGATAAGFYIMASWLASRLPFFVETPLLRVMLPVFAAHRDDRVQLGDLFKRTAMAINYLEATWCFLLIFNAGFVVLELFGHRWGPAIPFVILTAIYPLLSPLGTVGWEVLRMTGHTRLVLWNLVASSIAFVVVGVGLGVRIGVVGVVIGFYVATLVNSLVIFVLPRQIGWQPVRQVLGEVALLYLGCAVPLLVIGVLPIPAIVRFGIDIVVLGAIVLFGMRPLLPFIRSALARRGKPTT